MFNVITCEADRSAFKKSVVSFDCFGGFSFLQWGFTKDISLPLNRIFNPSASMAIHFAIKMKVNSAAM